VFYPFGEVDFEYVNGGSTDRRATDHHRTIPLEMYVPLILARMKQPSELPSFRVNPRDIRSLVRVILIAAQRQIIFSRWPVVFLSDNMIDLKREDIELLRDAAVFAGISRPLPDKVS